MIKITKFLYIHWLALPLTAVSYFAGGLYTLLAAYAVVTVHELFHLFAALLLRVRVKSIILMPFGMTLRLEGRVIKSPAREIGVALAGPLANLVMVFAALLLEKVYIWAGASLSFFIFINCILLVLNLLPVLPLDGGRVLRAILIRQLGFISAASVMKKITRATAVFLLAAGAAVFFVTGVNISLVIVAAFLLCNVTAEDKNNEYVFLKEILYTRDKLPGRGTLPVKLLAVHEDAAAGSLLKKFEYSRIHIINVIDSEMHITATLTEGEVVAAVIKEGGQLSAGKIAEHGQGLAPTVKV